MALLADSEFAGLRAALEVVLVHRYTRQAMTSGAVDSEGNAPRVPNGAAVTGVACSYGTVKRVVRDEGGTTIVDVPALTVSATDPLAVGDQVSAITDQLLAVMLAGPLRVERLLDDTAGLGASLLKVWELRAGTVSP